MSDGLSSLKEEDVQRLVRLIESLETSTFDYLQLQVGDLKVTIGKGAVPVGAPVLGTPALAAPVIAAPAVAAPANATPGPTIPATAPPALATPAVDAPAPAAPTFAAPAYAPPPPAPLVASPSPAPTPAIQNAAPAGTVDIKSHIMGMFYSQPEPGAPPFVSIGTAVKADTTICLIEVMKTFNAMTAGVNGVITEICAKNAQLVEYGQVLFRIRPS